MVFSSAQGAADAVGTKLGESGGGKSGQEALRGWPKFGAIVSAEARIADGRQLTACAARLPPRINRSAQTEWPGT